MKTLRMLLKVATGFTVCFFNADIYGATKEAPNENNTRWEMLKSVYDRMIPVTIFGKVVDTEEGVIADAEICISWEKPIYLARGKEAVTREWVKADSNGCWKITVGKADTTYIVSAQKAGFEYLPGPEAGKNFAEVKAGKETPIIIKLRKRGEPTFLITHEQVQILRATSPNSRTSDVDLLKEQRFEPTLYADFHLVVNYIPESNVWAMTCFVTNEADGIIFNNMRLYTAPAEGYLQKITLTGPSWPKFMYVRSRSPSIYSRLELDYVEAKSTRTNNTMCVRCKAWTNPYGERNLEYDESLDANWRVVDELRGEAIAAIRRKRLPTKPDIPQRIRATNERVAREKAESERRHNEWLEQQKRNNAK